jgi:hypothetical protein
MIKNRGDCVKTIVRKGMCFVLALISILFFSGIKADALSDNYNAYERGEKNYNSSYVYTQFKGTVKTPVGLFGQTTTYDGKSRSAWLGGNPYNADTVTHTDSISISGIGGASFGYPSGISVSTSGKTANISYSASNTWYVDVDYTYTASSWLILGVNQKAIGTFKFGSTFVVVDSKGNQVSGYWNYWVG